jgi:hypothetical protein
MKDLNQPYELTCSPELNSELPLQCTWGRA